jgi:hypothetical protein
MGNLENVNLMYYICCMKNMLDVLVVMFTLVFGLSMFNWIHNFSPSFGMGREIEIVKEEEE